MGEEIESQRREDLLSRFLKDYGLEVGADHRDDQKRAVEQYLCKQPREAIELKISGDQLFYVADDERRDDVVGDREEHDYEDCEEARPVGHRILHEP